VARPDQSHVLAQAGPRKHGTNINPQHFQKRPEKPFGAGAAAFSTVRS